MAHHLFPLLRRQVAKGPVLACGLVLCLAADRLTAADALPAKRVLMLFSEGKDLPVNVIVEQAAKTELQSHSTNRIEFYARGVRGYSGQGGRHGVRHEVGLPRLNHNQANP
jgi:hypothetical protein